MEGKSKPQGGQVMAGVKMEKVTNTWGSCAGVGSDFFYTYRKHRNTEMARLREMDREHEEQQEKAEFERKKAERQRESGGERAAKKVELSAAEADAFLEQRLKEKAEQERTHTGHASVAQMKAAQNLTIRDDQE
eukprot:GDKI01049687.1.p2 GENE.GDKI01049687.1~~GDKI01049687.1.p2  ORF type:complete len:134 (-),score=48.98 GDKI01049687.1:21-422(-)